MSNGFIVKNMPATLSGYKAHVYCEDLDQVDIAWNRLKDEVEIWGWGAKVADATFFEIIKPGNKQWGKGVTIYFPRRADWKSDLDHLVRLMAGRPENVQKPIQGDTYAGNGVSWRYEFHSDPGYDILPGDVMQWYKEASTKTAIGPNDPIYRALRNVQIPYDRERDGSLSGQRVADLAIAQLRSEGYGPEKPGSWWFVTPGGGELEGAKYWASSFGEYAGRNGDRANVGFIYEARFTERPELALGNESHIPGRKITIVAVHVTDSNNQWQRVELPTPIQTTAAKDEVWRGLRLDVPVDLVLQRDHLAIVKLVEATGRSFHWSISREVAERFSGTGSIYNPDGTVTMGIVLKGSYNGPLASKEERDARGTFVDGSEGEVSLPAGAEVTLDKVLLSWPHPGWVPNVLGESEHVSTGRYEWIPLGGMKFTASDKGLLEGAGVSIAGSLRTDASSTSTKVVRGFTAELPQGDRALAERFRDGTATAQDVVRVAMASHGHVGVHWGILDGDFDWDIGASMEYAYAEETPDNWLDEDDDDGIYGEVGIVLVGTIPFDPMVNDPAAYTWSHEIAEGTPVTLEEVHYFGNQSMGWRKLPASGMRVTSKLDNEALISVAEQTMERAGLAGDTILVPTGHMDDPTYQAAIEPLVQWVSDLCHQRVRFYASDYTLDTDGGGAQAMVTSAGSIVVRPITNTMTILHEVAHVLTRTTHGRGGHTDEYIEILEVLYRKHLGPAAADQFLSIVRMETS